MSGNTRRKSTRRSRTERISQFTTPVDDEALDFIQAIERFKVERGRAFPSWSDVLGVLKGLGYEKKPPQPPKS